VAATHACVAATHVLPLPPGLPFADGAAFAFTYGTSHHALMDRAALQAGETVLVLGAAGGVGTAAVQIAKAAGARVIAAVSSDDKAELCRRIGADATINYSVEPLREALKTLTDGKGPDVVYDPVGGAYAEQAFRAIAWRGRYLVVGFAAGGAIPALPLNLALLKGAAIVGVFWGDYVRREPRHFARDLQQLMQWYGEGRVKPVIDCRLPMTELPAAYARMGTRLVRGKVVLENA
jgi:NADPH2:quinone reductase